MFNRRHVAFLVSAVCLLLASGAAAAEPMTFTATSSPTHAAPGSAVSYSVTLKNVSPDDEADKAKIAIPPGFTVDGNTVVASAAAAGDCDASTWIADGPLIAVGKINLKRPSGSDHNLCPGATLVVVFSATAATAGAYSWAPELLRGDQPFTLIGDAPTVVVDGTPPNTTITSGPPMLTNQTSASFSFSSNELGGSFECSLDGATFASCTAASYSGLADGSHTFRVRAIDAAGNSDPTPAAYTWTVETRPPTATVTSGPGALTNSRSATFTFAADEPSSFHCELDGGSLAPCSSPLSYQNLGNGGHTLVVRPTDAVGNTGAPSSYSWTIDAIAPETRLGSRPRTRTPALSATFTFSASEAATFQCRLDAGTFTPCGSPKKYARLTRRTHRFEVRAVDAAGNVDSSPAVHRWTTATQRRTVKSASALFAPSSGARLTSPPLLRWRPVARATYYNVQLYRGRLKVWTTWPTGPRLQLRTRWTFLGRQQRLSPGSYRWYVWPGYGRASANRYGRLLGQSSFILVAHVRR